MLFVECNESARPYGLPSHRHLSEIEQELSNAAGEPVVIQFAPHLIPLNRGIITTIHADPVTELTVESLAEVYETAYGSESVHPIVGFRIDIRTSRTWLARIGWKLPGGSIREPGESF